MTRKQTKALMGGLCAGRCSSDTPFLLWSNIHKTNLAHQARHKRNLKRNNLQGRLAAVGKSILTRSEWGRSNVNCLGDKPHILLEMHCFIEKLGIKRCWKQTLTHKIQISIAWQFCLISQKKGHFLKSYLRLKVTYLCTAAQIHYCWGKRHCGKLRRACWSCFLCDLEHLCHRNYPARGWGSPAHRRYARSHNWAPSWT